jgi:hypothetical protein
MQRLVSEGHDSLAHGSESASFAAFLTLLSRAAGVQKLSNIIALVNPIFEATIVEDV